jgi:hypothetical protein
MSNFYPHEDAKSPFNFGSVDAFDAVSNQTIDLPQGYESTVTVLATGLHGNQTNQTFLVTYADGSMDSFNQNLSDWHTPQAYGGESIALKMPYRVTAGGADTSGPFYLYAYSFSVNSSKQIQSISLPSNRNVVVLSMMLSP